MNTYSKEELTGLLIKFNEKNGQPTIRKLKEAKDFPHPHIYMQYFGSWNNALEESGFNVNHRVYDEEELLQDLKQFHVELGRNPTCEDMRKNEKCASAHTYIKKFGSFTKALEKAGLNTKKGFLKEDLLNFIIKAKEELGHTPTYREFDSLEGYPCARTCADKFGFWNKALKEAGLKPTKESAYTKEYIINHLKKIARDIGDQYTRDTLNFVDGPHPSTVVNHFGSWDNAIKEAGLRKFEPGYSDDELVGYLGKLTENLGKIPTFKDMWKAEGYPGPMTFVRHFGSWNGALEESGLITVVEAYTPEESFDVLKPRIVAKALAHRVEVENYEEFMEIGDIVTDLFGFDERIVDKPLTKESRSLFYMLEKEGLITTDRDDDILHDGREWRTNYWKLNKKLIAKSAKEYDERKSNIEKEMSSEKSLASIYDEDIIWARKTST